MRHRLLIVATALLAVAAVAASATSAKTTTTTPRPVVLMHGLFASSSAMSHIQGWLEADFPGIYVKNVEIGDGKFDSLFMNLNSQVDSFTQQVQSDPQLAQGFTLIGHSQGGLITRGYIERHNSPVVHHWISLGGPHGGVYGLPDFNDWCPDVDCPWVVDFMSKISEKGDWLEPIMQNYVSFAEYWRDPFHLDAYLNSSGYLADINNERATKNATYRRNMVRITGDVHLVKALNDHIVVPKESEWFAHYADGQDVTLVNMTETAGYQGDWIGLKTLDQQQRLKLHAVECTHQNLPRIACKSVVYEAIIKPLMS